MELYLTVDEDGSEYLSDKYPFRDFFEGKGFWDIHSVASHLKLPKGSIKKLIGRELSWEDDCVELKDE